MARGPKRHLKRLNAPKHWMLDKLGGIWAPRPSTGPHKLRECMDSRMLHTRILSWFSSVSEKVRRGGRRRGACLQRAAASIAACWLRAALSSQHNV